MDLEEAIEKAHDSLESLWDDSQFIEDGEDNLRWQFLSIAFVSAELAWRYCQEFKELLPDQSNLGKLFKLYTVRSYSLLVYVYWFYELSRPEGESYTGDLTSLLHTLLGDASLCAEDSGRFLKTVMQVMVKSEGFETSNEVYQAYYCLYGLAVRVSFSRKIRLIEKVDNEFSLEEHEGEVMEFNKIAAAHVFEVVHKYVDQKLNKGYKTISLDLRDCIERISEFFTEPPWEQSLKVIDAFIASDIVTFENRIAFLGPRLPVLTFPEGYDFEIVYSKIFLLRAKILLAASKQKLSVARTWKSFETLEAIIKDLKFHIYMNCKDGDVWYQLGQCYASLANEYLSWSASEIAKSFEKIRTYQINAFNCLRFAASLPGIRILPSDASGTDQISVWSVLAQVCYTILSKPMASRSLGLLKSHAISKWQNRFSNSIIDGDGSVTKTQRMKFTAYTGYCLQKAFKASPNWYPLFLQAKLRQKSNFEDHKAKDVAVYLEKQAYGDEISKEMGFIILCEELRLIKAIDRKKWQHKPYWRHAWILKNVLNDVEGAKAQLLSLFHLKMTSKSFVNFWRPEFERPGKHFVYVHKYVLELVAIFQETEDVENLTIFMKKLRRAEDVLLHPDQVWQEAIKAFKTILKSGFESHWASLKVRMTVESIQSYSKELEKKCNVISEGEEYDILSMMCQLAVVKKLQEEDERDDWFDKRIVELYACLCLRMFPEVASKEITQSDEDTLFAAVLKKAIFLAKPKNARSKAGTEEQDAQQVEETANETQQ
ncbi:Histone transcription regulator 3 [Phlyctochytrium planicorne]|nr:Histone transcription regulator 3 [Phlyctochytrium planicorne]